MIKFFRHIRRSLINQNKMGKYFKYAIGEILLVVIGILIALQINTWNENRINQKKTTKYLKALVSDIVQDTIQVSNYIKSQEERKAEFNNYFSFIQNGDVTIEQLKDTLNSFKIISGGINFTTTTYDQLVASGSFELIPDKKRTLIIGYFAATEDLENYIDGYDESKKIERSESRKYLDLEGSKYDLFKALNYKPEKEFMLQGLKHLHNTVKLEYFKSQFSKAFGEFYLEAAKTTITNLSKE